MDITESLQQSLNSQAKGGGPTDLPSGRFYISDTITTPFITGCTIRTAGACEPVTDARKRGCATELIWRGPLDGRPPLKVTGTHLRITGGLSILGHDPIKGHSPDTRAPLGILITKPATSLGTGKVVIDHLFLSYFEVAIQNGSSAGEHNCESNTFTRVETKDCGTVFKCMNSQGMGHWFGDVVADADCVFDVHGGGMINARNILCAGTILRLHGGKSIGRANATFVLDGVKVDGGQTASGVPFCLVDMVDPVSSVVVLSRGGRISNPSAITSPVLELKHPSARVVLDGWAGLPTDVENVQAGKVEVR